jgi:hypothetical protein
MAAKLEGAALDCWCPGVGAMLRGIETTKRLLFPKQGLKAQEALLPTVLKPVGQEAAAHAQSCPMLRDSRPREKMTRAKMCFLLRAQNEKQRRGRKNPCRSAERLRRPCLEDSWQMRLQSFCLLLPQPLSTGFKHCSPERRQKGKRQDMKLSSFVALHERCRHPSYTWCLPSCTTYSRHQDGKRRKAGCTSLSRLQSLPLLAGAA